MDIDIVVAWVDGADPRHLAKRRRFAGEASKDDLSAASGFRFKDHGEVRYCLRSLTNFAPWARKVWLVTDGQFPPYLSRRRARRSRIEVVDHAAIFRGFEEFLPTFNSNAIETMMWRIPGLAERFVYFQDDMFLTGPTGPGHFFPDGLPLLRGTTESAAAMGATDAYSARVVNGARLAGVEGDAIFAPAHVAHPMLRPLLEELFDGHRAAFLRNAGFRFRDPSQFNVVTLHDATALRTGRATVRPPPDDWVHFTVARSRAGSRRSLRRRLARMRRPGNILVCANDYRAITTRIGAAAAAFDRVAGPPAPYEDVPPREDATPREAGVSWHRRLARGLRRLLGSVRPVS